MKFDISRSGAVLRTSIMTMTAVLVILLSTPALAQNYTVLHTFTGGADGGGVSTLMGPALIGDGEGNLYGTAAGGGDLQCPFNFWPGCGVVFKIDGLGNEQVLYTFTGGTDGGDPSAGLLRDRQGNLYGTTDDYGLGGVGVVFKLDQQRHERVLYSFTGSDGRFPTSNLIADEQGNLYGVTQHGGAFGSGTVFTLAPNGNETVLYSFTGGADGSGPFAGVIRDNQGNLYGTTVLGGSSGSGVVFKIDPNGNETVLYTFTGGADGAFPWGGGLIRDESGNLYGAASGGGNLQGICAGFGCGVIFKVDPNGNETVLYTFTGGADGDNPWAPPVRDGDGNLYGTTIAGGDLSTCSGFGCGVVFRLDSSGTETVLHTFSGLADGAVPTGLLLTHGGILYGTTENGGATNSTNPLCQLNFAPGCGVVFKLSSHP